VLAGLRRDDPGMVFVDPTCTHRLTLGRAESIIRAQRSGRKILAGRSAAGSAFSKAERLMGPKTA
jgi:hypothetical protein